MPQELDRYATNTQEQATGLRIYLLGVLYIEHNNETIRLPRRKVEALLAYLILHPEPQTRDALATRFWGDTTDEKARHSLRTALATLRQQFGDSFLLADRDQVQINPDFPIWVDLRALLAASKLVDEFDLTNPTHIHATLALWRGGLLADFYEDWVIAEREHYQSRLHKVFLDLVQRLRTRSEYPQAIEVAQKLLTFDPGNEQAHQHLMFCFMAMGERAAALRQYQQCERELRAEYEAAPSPETRALYQWIKQQESADDSLSAKITNLPIPLTSFVGRTSQLREIKWLINPAAHKRDQNQSRLLTLVGAGGSGKTRLAIQVATDLIDSFEHGVWWVDLTALNDETQVARAVAKALGVQVLDDQKLPHALINFLGDKQLLLVIDNCEHLLDACSSLLAELLAEAPELQILTTSREPLHIAGETLWHVPTLSQPERALLAAPQAEQIDQLLQADCMRLFVERATAVQQGFRLTPENAQAIATICERLDGIPLAIELAAARVRVLSVQQIADYLTSAIGARFELLTQNRRAALPRQQTLYAAIDWSYNLLDEKERALFRQVAVFHGGFTVEALQAILDFGFSILDLPVNVPAQPIENPKSKIQNLLDFLTQLIDKSLIIAETEESQKRYRLLESLREYALGRAAASAELTAVQQRHAEYFLALAEQAAPALRSFDQMLWLERLTQEYNNLHAALAWFEKMQQTEAGLRLSNALFAYWDVRAYSGEGQRWLTTFLQQSGTEPNQRIHRIEAQNSLALLTMNQSNWVAAQTLFQQNLLLARQSDYAVGIEDALIGTAAVQWELGEYRSAAATIDEALQLCRASQHIAQLTRATGIRGLIDWSLGDLPAASDGFSQALALARKTGNAGKAATSLFNLALIKTKQGAYAEARRLYEEAISLSRQLGDEDGIADVLLNLGDLAADLGDFSLATTHFQEATQINQKLGDHADIGYSLIGLGEIDFFNGHYGQAQSQLQEALGIFRNAGNKRMTGRALSGLGWVAVRQGELSTAATFCDEALTLTQSIGHKAGTISVLEEGYAELAAALGQPVVATRLMAATDATYEEISSTRPPVKTRQIERLRQQLQSQLGEAAFATAWDEGQTMSLDQAVALARGIRPPSQPIEGEPTESDAPFRFYALGPGRVYQGKRLLTSADWTYDKARELVFYLLSHPNASQTEIGLYFWPDANSEQVRKRFSAALSHARNALGRQTEWIIRSEGRYRIDLARAIWFDVEVFEAKLKEAKSHLQGNAASDKAMQLLREATDLYQGDFVADLLEGEWYQARRTALSQANLDALLLLAGLYSAAQRLECAISTYQRALERDPYLEEAHTDLIRSFARLNQGGQAIRQSEALVTALRDLGVAPSPETQTLLHRVRRGEPV